MVDDDDMERATGGHGAALAGLIALAALVLLGAGLARGAGYAAFGFSGLLLLAWLTGWRRLPHLNWQPVAWLGALGGLAVLSIAWALDRHASAVRAAEMLPLLLLGGAGIAAAPALAARVPRRFLWLLPAAYGLALLLTSLDLYDGFLLQRLVHGGDRMVGAKHLIRPQLLNRDWVFLSLLYAPVNGIILALPGWKKTWRLAAMAALLVVALSGLLVTASQTAQLMILLIILVALFFPYRFAPAWWLAGIAVAGLVLGAPWLSEALYDRLAPAIAGAQNQEIVHAYMPQRMEIWSFVSHYALHRPLTGFGIDATRAVPAFDNPRRFTQSLTVPHPHNFAVQLWMEFGIIGAALGAALLVATLHAIHCRPVAQQRILLPTYVASLGAAAMTFSLWQGWWLGTLVFAALLANFTAALLPPPDLPQEGEDHAQTADSLGA